MLVSLALVVFAGVSFASEANFQAGLSAPVFGDTQPVGTVSLALGRSFIESQNNNRERVRSGMVVRQADRIVTESNGHVHIRFVDEALISVRPNSALEILAYIYNAEDPEKSSVKFNLLEGTARAVSGNAAEAARHRVQA